MAAVDDIYSLENKLTYRVSSIRYILFYKRKRTTVKLFENYKVFFIQTKIIYKKIIKNNSTF